MSILELPTFKDLESETKRERLLYFKAYVEGFEAALRAVEHFGLEQATITHKYTMAEITKDIEAKVENSE